MGARGRFLLIAVYLGLLLVKLDRHEIWQDEAEYWDAARESQSLSELRHNTVYMGQPPLNHLLFYAASRFSRDPRLMQILNALEMTAAVAVVLCFAPFTRLQCVLFALGYFPFFEYGTISRHYALMLLCAVSLCAAFRRKGRLTPAVAGLGVLLALSNFHGTLLVLALLASLLTTWLWTRYRPAREEVLSALALAAAIVLSVAAARPPADSVFLKPWLRPLEDRRALVAAVQPAFAYAPLPPLAPPWWGRSLLEPWPGVRVALGAALFGLLFWGVRRSRLAALFLLFATTGLLAFGYLQWGGAARHAGVLFVAAVVSLWLAGSRSWLVTALLAMQVPGSLVLSYRDLVGLFSPSVPTAEYIRSHGLADLPIVGYKEFTVSPVFTLLDRPFFSPASDRWRTRPVFSGQMHTARRSDIGRAARRLQRKRNTDVLLVLDTKAPCGRRIRLLTCFSDEFYPRQFCIYRLPAAPAEAVVPTGAP